MRNGGYSLVVVIILMIAILWAFFNIAVWKDKKVIG